MGEEVVAMSGIKKVLGVSREKEKSKRNEILSSSSRHPCLGILWELKRTEDHGRRDAGTPGREAAIRRCAGRS